MNESLMNKDPSLTEKLVGQSAIALTRMTAMNFWTYCASAR